MKTKSLLLGMIVWTLGAIQALHGGIFTNLTPQKVPENPSGIYVISFSAIPTIGSIVKGTDAASLVIDEKTVPMKKSSVGNYIYEYEYKMPAGQNAAKYYFTFEYQVEIEKHNSHEKKFLNTRVMKEYSEIFKLELINRYVYQPEADRGPVGVRIAVIGRNFSAGDKILVNGQEAQTIYNSANSVSFVVPNLPAGKTYPLSLRTSMGPIDIGNFLIDPATLVVRPPALNLAAGASDQLEFQIPFEARTQGLIIDVKTDVPESIIMPEVVIPAGLKSVKVKVQGGKPGKGELLVNSTGFATIKVPVNVY